MKATALLFSASFALAPIQCKHDPDPNNRLEDTAGDALWNLAEQEKRENDDAASKKALRYLVEHYPSNRHAPAARAALGISGADASAP